MRGFSRMVNGRLVAAGVFSLLAINANSAKAVLIESWEGSLDGWQVPSPAGTGSNLTFTSAFNNSNGVTDGSDSLAITGPSAGPNYSQLLLGPSSLGLTTLLGGASAVQLDVYTPPGSFGYFLQFDVDINNADTGFVSLDGYSYPGTSIGSESTITVPVSPTIAATLAASSNPTALIIQAGGGYTAGNETMYLDNLRTVPASVPEPASLSLLGGGLALLMRRRRA